MNGEDFALQDKDVLDVQRKLAMIWNMYDFFTTYAEVDKWEWNGAIRRPFRGVNKSAGYLGGVTITSADCSCDQAHGRLQYPRSLVRYPAVSGRCQQLVCPPISRRRFWKSEDDGDKQQAYRTLHYVLTQLSLVMAPFTPFLAEELFLKLTGGELGESVHLLDWPKQGTSMKLALNGWSRHGRLSTEGLSSASRGRYQGPSTAAIMSRSRYPGLALVSELEREQLERGKLLPRDHAAKS